MVTLLVEGKRTNILDPSRLLCLVGPWQLEVRELFRIVDKANIRQTRRLQVFEEGGLRNFDEVEWGTYDAEMGRVVGIDLERPDFWKTLPVYRSLTSKQASEDYGLVGSGSWASVWKANRATRDQLSDRKHSYLEIVIPNGDGTFRVMPLGKYPRQQTRHVVEFFFKSGRTIPGAIHYPDVQDSFLHREQVQVVHRLTDEEGRRLMENLRRALQQARAGELDFQFQGNNCSKFASDSLFWARGIDGDWDRMEQRIVAGDLPASPYLVDIWDVQLKGVSGWVIRLISSVRTKSLRQLLHGLVFAAFGSGKGMEVPGPDGQRRRVRLIDHVYFREEKTHSPLGLLAHHDAMGKRDALR
ncbi:MAG: hypothetical protein HN348_22795 [Proteobacteria bacterium]|nr:hypothetical protein [Pseudomonadota bacterium]